MLSNLLGTWKLSHCKSHDINGIEQFDPFHDGLGTLIYDKSGNMAAQIMKSNHADSISGNIFAASAESFKNAFENYVAYYGTYVIDEEKSIVTHSIIGALWPNMIGISVSRRFEFKDDNNTLVLSNVQPEALANKNLITRYLTWNKVTAPLS